jgi:antibiotic biosynthesis monooxygenase (ABM) superfamily enzyme
MTDSTSATSREHGATVVITHRVREGCHAQYDAWLNEIAPLSRTSKGHIDWQIIRPVAGLTSTYTVVLRFDSRANLESWMGSSERSRLIEKVRPLLATDDEFFVRTGLDFWFVPEAAQAKVPPRWKQFLVTWSAIYPLSLLASSTLVPLLRRIGVPPHRSLDAVFVSGAIVALMVFVVMPRYTRLVRRWLFA